MIELLERHGFSVEELSAKKTHMLWSQAFHALLWDDLDFQLKEADAIQRYAELAANPFLLMYGHMRRLRAVLCQGNLPDYGSLVALHDQLGGDDLYLMPETFAWTFILSHEMYSLCPGPIFAVPFRERS